MAGKHSTSNQPYLILCCFQITHSLLEPCYSFLPIRLCFLHQHTLSLLSGTALMLQMNTVSSNQTKFPLTCIFERKQSSNTAVTPFWLCSPLLHHILQNLVTYSTVHSTWLFPNPHLSSMICIRTNPT